MLRVGFSLIHPEFMRLAYRPFNLIAFVRPPEALQAV